jgi:hypothetical protein
MPNYTCPANATSDNPSAADCDDTTMSGFYIIAVITAIVIAAGWIYKHKCKKSQESIPATIECVQPPVVSYSVLPSAPLDDDPK